MSTLRQAAQSVIEQWGGPDWKDGDIAQIDAVYSALRTALAAPEQAPVANVNISYFRGQKSMTNVDFELQADLPEGVHMLYAAPVEVEALTKERDDLLLQIDIQGGSIDAVQAANQRLFASIKDCVKRLDEALRDTADLAIERDEYRAKYNECYEVLNDLIKERDALMAARYAYATEFALDEEGQPDVGSIHQNIRELKSAAKLALDAALNVYATCDWYGDDGRDAMESLSKAIDTIRKAGVQ